MTAFPSRFLRTIVELYGEAGRKWLRQLPALIDEYAQRWSLRVQRPFPHLSYNYVAPATAADGTELVLKLGVPNPELTTEIEALRLYNGRGAAKLLNADAERGVLLLERLQPGTQLVTLEDDEEATAIAAAVMAQLWRPLPPNHPFPTVEKWAGGLSRLRQRFGGGTGPLPERLVAMAETLFRDLPDSTAEPVLLHGDLHHFNILAATRQPWLAIDPKGVAGEPAYEVGAFLRNPMPDLLAEPDLQSLLARRVEQLVEMLGLERERVLGWGMAQAVLSAWWSMEDHGRVGETAVTVASLLAELLS